MSTSFSQSPNQPRANASRYFSVTRDGKTQVMLPSITPTTNALSENKNPKKTDSDGWTWSSAELCCECHDELEPGAVCYLDRRRVCKQCYRKAIHYIEVKHELDGQAMAVAVCVGLATVAVLVLASLGAGL